MSSQGLLFAEPAIAETGLWCELTDGIDPTRWARVCRRLSNPRPGQFNKTEQSLISNPDSMKNRIKRIFCFRQEDFGNFPLVCINPIGVNSKG